MLQYFPLDVFFLFLLDPLILNLYLSGLRINLLNKLAWVLCVSFYICTFGTLYDSCFLTQWLSTSNMLQFFLLLIIMDEVSICTSALEGSKRTEVPWSPKA